MSPSGDMIRSLRSVLNVTRTHAIAQQMQRTFASMLPGVQAQAWVTSFETGKKNGLIDLHSDVWRVMPRFDILHENVRWQERYRCMVTVFRFIRHRIAVRAGVHEGADALRDTRL